MMLMSYMSELLFASLAPHNLHYWLALIPEASIRCKEMVFEEEPDSKQRQMFSHPGVMPLCWCANCAWLTDI